VSDIDFNTVDSITFSKLSYNFALTIHQFFL